MADFHVGQAVTIDKGHNSVKGRPGTIAAIVGNKATVLIGGRQVDAPLSSLSPAGHVPMGVAEPSPLAKALQPQPQSPAATPAATPTASGPQSPAEVQAAIVKAFRSGTFHPGEWKPVEPAWKGGSWFLELDGQRYSLSYWAMTSYKKTGRLRIPSGTRNTRTVDLNGPAGPTSLGQVVAVGESAQSDAKVKAFEDRVEARIAAAFGIPNPRLRFY
jgi:hypothetical protein